MFKHFDITENKTIKKIKQRTTTHITRQYKRKKKKGKMVMIQNLNDH
jgi:hypothetical protein